MSTRAADILVVLCNTPDESCANRIAQALVTNRLAACVNRLAPCHSVYRWQDKLEEATEVPLLIKTTAERYTELEAAIRSLHPYEVPEIIALPLIGGLADYLGWVAEESSQP